MGSVLTGSAGGKNNDPVGVRRRRVPYGGVDASWPLF